ncbi:MAG: hypothetical protein ACM33T_17670 [Solirubrobacterales bacterium]
MNMIAHLADGRREQSAKALRQALGYLEQEALECGLEEIALLIGCAKMALEDTLDLPACRSLH